MKGAGKSAGLPVYTGTIFNYDQAPQTSPNFASQKEAKKWCSQNNTYEDCVWVVLKDGLFIAGGIIDGMWEEDSYEDEPDDEA
jgi:hypothetical protein